MEVYLVGGAVRDKYLSLPVTERDWVVVGATPDALLAKGFTPVGKSFPVFLHPDTKEEYALARTEKKVAPGYKGFVFNSDPSVTLEEDLMRRDLTINAMAEGPSGQLIDPYGGKSDLDNRLLRHVSDAFKEDPVRVLRVARFKARFHHLGFVVANETLQLMQAIVASNEMQALTAERIWKEFFTGLKEPHPEQFIAILNSCGALEILFPEFMDASYSKQLLALTSNQSVSPLIRFALFCYPLTMRDNRLDCLKAFCQRLRTPKSYYEMAKLTVNFSDRFLTCRSDSVSELYDLFVQVDVIRRFERFEQFLIVCQWLAHYQKLPFELNHYRNLAAQMKAVKIDFIEFKEQNQHEIQQTIRQLRMEALEVMLKK